VHQVVAHQAVEAGSLVVSASMAMKETKMNKQRQRNTQATQHQRGAVAIIVAICLALLVGMLGLVLDLGHLYVAKTELQNAADAAALSGAKELDGSLDGVNSAKVSAIEAAGKNKYDLNATEVTIDETNLEFSNSPDEGWVDFATAQASPADKTFLKVDTGKEGTDLQSFNTWFIHVLPGAASIMQTFGMAVAGKYAVNITPLGVCAISLVKNATDSTTNELIEFGFRRGIAYNIPQLNPLGASGVPMWINPVDAPPSSCDPSHSSAAFTVPFVCEGSTSSIRTLPQLVYVNTGASASLEKALNSRFDRFTGSQCDPTSAPPDTNIKEFTANAGNPNPASCPSSTTTTSGCGFPRDWMDTLNSTTPTQQPISLAPGPSGRLAPVTTPTYLQYGALWSFSRAMNGATSIPFNASNSHWSTLYNSGVSLTTLINIPTATGGSPVGGYPDPADTSMSPYKKGNEDHSSKYFSAPAASRPGTANRRVLTVAIVDCDSLVVGGGGLACGQINLVGLGNFFMQVPANLPTKIEGEFAGLVPESELTSVIRLYH